MHINHHIDFHDDSCVHMHKPIIMQMNMVVDMYTDSLSFKFYEDPFIGCREIAEINMSMHYSHFLKHVTKMINMHRRFWSAIPPQPMNGSS